MSQPTPIDELTRLLTEPSYESEVRTAASCLENRAKGVFGIPVVAVQISPQYARYLATLLRNHADDVEHNGRG